MGEQLVLPGVGDIPIDAPPEPARPASSRRLTARTSLPAAAGAFEGHMREQGFAENTTKAFLSDLALLTQFLGAGKAVGDVSTPEIRRFTYWLANERGTPCSPKTLARRVTADRLPRALSVPGLTGDIAGRFTAVRHWDGDEKVVHPIG